MIRSTSSASSCCTSSDEDSFLSRDSVDLEEDRLRSVNAERGDPPLLRTTTIASTAAIRSMRGFFAADAVGFSPPRPRSMTAPSEFLVHHATTTVERGRTNNTNNNDDNNTNRHYRTTMMMMMDGQLLDAAGEDARRHRPSSSFVTLPPLLRRRRSVTTAHSRRNLLVLFLVALYTTFGLTTPNIPAASLHQDDLLLLYTIVPEAAAAQFVQVTELADATTDASASESSNSLMAETAVGYGLRGSTAKDSSHQQQQRKVATGLGGQSKLSFARKINRQMLTFHKKEMTDFYHQKALQDESSNLSWYYYINCSVLVAIALWAWRERSSTATPPDATTTTRSSLQ